MLVSCLWSCEPGHDDCNAVAGHSSQPKMKLKTRVVFLGFLSSILFISFKILEPEIQEHPGGKEVVPEQDYVDQDGYRDSDEEIQVKPNEIDGKIHEANHMFNDSNARQAIVQRFLEMYDLDWNYKIKNGKDPFKVAAGWVTPRSLHPEFAPEIGEFKH